LTLVAVHNDNVQQGGRMSFQGYVHNGVVVFDEPPGLPEGTPVVIEPVAAVAAPKQPRTSLASWAEQNAESWGEQLRSEDVEGFTGRSF
jgi:hypothetical protein